MNLSAVKYLDFGCEECCGDRKDTERVKAHLQNTALVSDALRVHMDLEVDLVYSSHQVTLKSKWIFEISNRKSKWS